MLFLMERAGGSKAFPRWRAVAVCRGLSPELGNCLVITVHIRVANKIRGQTGTHLDRRGTRRIVERKLWVPIDFEKEIASIIYFVSFKLSLVQ